MLDGLITFPGHTFREKGLSAFWISAGRIAVGTTEADIDILRVSQERGTGLIDSLFVPLGDLVCPTNELSGKNAFPLGGRRDFGPGARPGHETVGFLVAATPEALHALRSRDADLGQLGVVNINMGCGLCEACRSGASPDVCGEGQTFVGLGHPGAQSGNTSGGAAGSWVERETGRRELPGFLTELEVPVASRQFHPLPLQQFDDLRKIFTYALADAAGCVRNAVDVMGMVDLFPRFYRGRSPEILLVGAGRLGLLFSLTVKDLLPEARICAVDIRRKNLDLLKRIAGVEDTFEVEKDSLVRSVIEIVERKRSGRNFHYIMSCAPQGAVSAEDINNLAEKALLRRGRTGRLDHTELSGIDSGSERMVEYQILHTSALGPADNFPYALSLLTRNLDSLSETVEVIEEVFTKNPELLKEITETSGGPFRERMECISVCAQINPVPARFLASSGASSS